MNDDFHSPNFNLGEFRDLVALYVKLLIRARWKTDAGFLSDSQLTQWGLKNIQRDKLQAWQLLAKAAYALETLNANFIPRCGSGGIPEEDNGTPVSRLVDSVAFLVQPEGGGPAHNQVLVNAADGLRRQEAIDWQSIADWQRINAIRDDLDLLPQRKQGTEKKPRELNVTARFPSPSGLCWEAVTIRFVSDDAVKISAKGVSETYMFSEMGFRDGRKGDRPNTRWSILKKLAEQGGRFDWDSNLTLKERNCLQAAIKDIRKRLQALIGLTDDPFHDYRSKKGYEAKFTIVVKSTSDHSAEIETE
jgi:hypothetical protein